MSDLQLPDPEPPDLFRILPPPRGSDTDPICFETTLLPVFKSSAARPPDRSPTPPPQRPLNSFIPTAIPSTRYSLISAAIPSDELLVHPRPRSLPTRYQRLLLERQMATQASSNAQNENMHVMRGKQIDVKANVPKPEKKDRKERKALADLSNLKNRGSTVLKPSTLKQKASFTGSKTTKKSQTSCILSDEETKKCYEWAEEGIETAHFTSIDMLKHEKDAMDKRVKEEVQMVMSCMKEWNWILYDYASPVKTIDVDTDEIKKLEFEPEILLPEPSLSPTSDLDGDILEEPEIDWAYFVDRCDFKLKENNEDGVPS